MSRVLTVVGTLFFVVTAVGAVFLSGYVLGEKNTHMKWEDRQRQAEKEAEDREKKWAEEESESRERLEAREKGLEQRRQLMDAAWKALVEALPDCDLPPDVGVQLNEAAGVSPAT